MSSEELLNIAVEATENKKAEDITINKVGKVEIISAN